MEKFVKPNNKQRGICALHQWVSEIDPPPLQIPKSAKRQLSHHCHFDPKTGFFDKNRKLFPNLFPNYFCKNFTSSKRSDISDKISELRKPNYSETRKNKKLGKFRLTQGLTFWICSRKS